ncbi:MAG: hypothetical protein AAF378_21170, partial [Cyanobacteria bacterium P01_A01_bin.84]
MTQQSISSENQEVLKLSWESVIFFALFHFVALLAPWFFSWSAFGVMIFLHWLLGSIGICLGYHRLLSHRSFQVPQWLEYILTTLGALAMQGGPLFWKEASIFPTTPLIEEAHWTKIKEYYLNNAPKQLSVEKKD